MLDSPFIEEGYITSRYDQKEPNSANRAGTACIIYKSDSWDDESSCIEEEDVLCWPQMNWNRDRRMMIIMCRLFYFFIGTKPTTLFSNHCTSWKPAQHRGALEKCRSNGTRRSHFFDTASRSPSAFYWLKTPPVPSVAQVASYVESRLNGSRGPSRSAKPPRINLTVFDPAAKLIRK